MKKEPADEIAALRRKHPILLDRSTKSGHPYISGHSPEMLAQLDQGKGKGKGKQQKKSRPYKRPATFSPALGERIIMAIAGGASEAETARQLGLGSSTISGWRARGRETQDAADPYRHFADRLGFAYEARFLRGQCAKRKCGLAGLRVPVSPEVLPLLEDLL